MIIVFKDALLRCYNGQIMSFETNVECDYQLYAKLLDKRIQGCAVNVRIKATSNVTYLLTTPKCIRLRFCSFYYSWRPHRVDTLALLSWDNTDASTQSAEQFV